MPEADSATIGGALDTTKQVAWYDLSANDTIDAVSSSASDTATKVQVMGRDATGVVATSSAATMTGTTDRCLPPHRDAFGAHSTNRRGEFYGRHACAVQAAVW